MSDTETTIDYRPDPQTGMVWGYQGESNGQVTLFAKGNSGRTRTVQSTIWDRWLPEAEAAAAATVDPDATHCSACGRKVRPAADDSNVWRNHRGSPPCSRYGKPPDTNGKP